MKSHYSCQVAAAIHNAALSLDGTYLGQGKRQKVCFSVLKDIGTSNWRPAHSIGNYPLGRWAILRALWDCVSQIAIVLTSNVRHGESLELSPARAYLPDENFPVLILGTRRCS